METPLMDQKFSILQLLAYVVKNKGSDLHLRVGTVPSARINGDIRQFDQPAICESGDIQIMMQELLGQDAFHQFENARQSRFLASHEGLGCFEVQLAHMHGQLAASIRVQPARILTLDELEAPDIFREITEGINNGLILINGKIGSGWMTTMAALRQEILATQDCHVVSLSSVAFANQTGIKSMHSSMIVGPGFDVRSFDVGLERTEKIDPDYIFIMESLDNLPACTVRRILDLARFGYCVVASVNADSTDTALRLVLGLLDYRDCEYARRQMAAVLRYSICQRLFRTPGGSGRVACHEILCVLPDIRQAISNFDMDKISRVLASHSISISMKRAAKVLLERGLLEAAEFDRL